MNRDCFCTGECRECTGTALAPEIATHEPGLLLHRGLPRPRHEHRNCESSECKDHEDGTKWMPLFLLVLSLLSLLLLLSLTLV